MTQQDFVNKYNIGESFEQMYDLMYKKNRSENFLFKDEAITSEKKNYLDGLKYMLSVYMANQINPVNVENAATLENFDIAQFIRDYEAAKLDEFNNSKVQRERKAYENVGARALDEVLAYAKTFNKPLSDIWADSIKKGAKLDSFRTATSQNTQKSDVNTIIARRALEKVINERTWGWRLNPFNWSRLREENRLMRDLTAKANTINIDLLDTTHQEMLNKYSAPILSNTKIEQFEETCKNAKHAKSANKENVNKKSAKTKVKGLASIKKPKTRHDVGKLFNDVHTTDIVRKEISNILSKGNKAVPGVSTAVYNIHTGLKANINEMWVSTEKMHENAIRMFRDVYGTISKDMRQMSVTDKLVAAQKITNVMINVYSPAALDQNMEKYSENYAITNMESADIKNLTDHEGDVDKLMDDVMVELGLKERIIFNASELGESIHEKSLKIEDNNTVVQKNLIG